MKACVGHALNWQHSITGGKVVQHMVRPAGVTTRLDGIGSDILACRGNIGLMLCNHDESLIENVQTKTSMRPILVEEDKVLSA